MTAGEGTVVAAEKKPGRGPLWGLLIVTGLPFLLALYLYLNPGLLKHFGTKNHGQLVQPPRSLPGLQVQTLEGAGLDLGSLKGNWTLILAADSACDEGCQKNLYYLRQIRRAMGENRSRVQRLLVLSDNGDTHELGAKLQPFEGTAVVVGPDPARGQLLELLRVDKQAVNGRMYIADPQGRVILAYPPNPPWKDVLKDLEYLLKVVQQ